MTRQLTRRQVLVVLVVQYTELLRDRSITLRRRACLVQSLASARAELRSLARRAVDERQLALAFADAQPVDTGIHATWKDSATH